MRSTSRSPYLYRAVDQHGQVIDVLVSKRRDAAAARALFTRAVTGGCPSVGFGAARLSLGHYPLGLYAFLFKLRLFTSPRARF
jgi:DDE domain